MALNIKNPDVERLVAEVARLTGETKTQAIRRAMEDGYSTSGRLGLGLPGVRRLMDEFEIHTAAGQGTTVTVKKWIP